jgi:hypothetical protein
LTIRKLDTCTIINSFYLSVPDCSGTPWCWWIFVTCIPVRLGNINNKDSATAPACPVSLLVSPSPPDLHLCLHLYDVHSFPYTYLRFIRYSLFSDFTMRSHFSLLGALLAGSSPVARASRCRGHACKPGDCLSAVSAATASDCSSFLATTVTPCAA